MAAKSRTPQPATGATTNTRIRAAMSWHGPRIIESLVGPALLLMLLLPGAAAQPASLDSQGHAHLAYGTGYFPSYALRYAYWNGTVWVTQTLASLQDIGFLSLALDAADHPRISYFSQNGSTGVGSLNYVEWSGGAWHSEVVDSAHQGRFYDSSLALDASGSPRISYTDGATGRLQYAARVGGTWIKKTVAEPGGRRSSLALDAAGAPRISYQAGDDLECASWTGSDWRIELVDQGGTAGVAPLIAIDGAGQVHIAEDTRQGVKYASRTDQGWTVSFVDRGHSVALTLAPTVPYTAHVVYGGDGPVYAYLAGSTWITQSIESGVMAGGMGSNSIALDRAGHPHVSYYSTVAGASPRLEYASYVNGSWAHETVDDGAIPYGTSLSLDGADHPHIVYADYCQGLKYAHWTGMSWSIETVEQGCGVRGASLALDSLGAPHISYIHDGAVKYAWLAGDGWDTAIIKTGYGCCSWTALRLDGAGLPHAVFPGLVVSHMRSARIHPGQSRLSIRNPM